MKCDRRVISKHDTGHDNHVQYYKNGVLREETWFDERGYIKTHIVHPLTVGADMVNTEWLNDR